MISFKPRITRISARGGFAFGEKRYGLHRFVFMLILLLLTSCDARHPSFMEGLDLKCLKDGTYVGQDAALMCSVKLAITIKQGKITDIKILSHYVTYPLAGRAYDIIPKRIVEKQSLDVDAVTAATVSSNNIKRAVLMALEKVR